MDKQLLDQFIQFLRASGKSNSTVIAYHKDLQQLSSFISTKYAGLTFSAIDTEVLNGFVEQITNSGEFTLKTVSRKINSMKTFFRYLLEKSLIKINPATEVKHPKLTKQAPRVLSGLEYRAVRDSARTNIRLFTIVELLLQSGLRIGELARLNRADVAINGNEVTLNIVRFESYPARKIILNETARLAVKEYLSKVTPSANGDFLFYTKTGKSLLIRNIRAAIDKLFEKSEINKATVNDIRNTFIVYQLNNGMDIKALATYVGHQKLITTQRYMEFVKKRPSKTQTKVTAL